ncbi:Rpn family recombination-promoting nuclease/putative transposase [Cupriavidus cauae]|uniref:Rpn family recombination-promoting nuclease/putative transposase n=1 Tax=Cupriavidus cauae TaxID=2608999 RepID=UPI0022444650|nr:Rpn family recombination-promoting nuclease/putative transposase [Cupriavidus cauae]UZN49636.1 Rpn family recombination-promoting nuclease/putative transposase [Cupriavidus cauae]
MPSHDACYKLLFSTPEFVRDLLRDFVPSAWVRALDFDTLERISSNYVTDRLRQRASDMVWRIQAGGEWVYLYLLIEFQSTIDRHMAIRMTNYVTSLDLELIRGRNILPDGQLPPVLPIVVYNGEGSWTAKTDIAELSPRLPDDLCRCQPRCEYLLVDARRYSDEELATLDNLVAAVFRFENAETETAMLEAVRWIRLRVADDPVLEDTFVRWLKHVGSRHRRAGLYLTDIHNLMEAEMSLSTNIAQWKANYKREGLQEGWQVGLQEGRREGRQVGLQEGRQAGLQEGRQVGLQEGRQAGLQEGRQVGLQEGRQAGLQEGRQVGLQEGLQQGQAMLLRNLLAKRFGPLPAELESRLNSARLEQLEAWGERLLSAQHLADVFED